MSDFKVQYISGTLAAGSLSQVLAAPADFDAVGATTKAFVMPASSMPTCGFGVSTDGGEIRQWAISAHMTAVDAITIQRGDATADVPYAFWIIEYTGVAGGANEFIVRGRGEMTYANGVLTGEGAAIAGIVTLNSCVPFVSGRFSTLNSTALRNFMSEVVIANNGTSNVVQFTRITNTGSPVFAWQAVEFTGSNWTIQQGRTTGYNTANADVNTAITAVASIAKTWVHTYFANTLSNGPLGATVYAWLSSTTQLRSRIPIAATNSGLRWWVIENADATFKVEQINAVDGVMDFVAGSSPQTQTIPITRTRQRGVFVTARMGSTETVSTNNPAAAWRVRQSDEQTIEVFRTKSLGDTEYVAQVVQLPGDSIPTALRYRQNTLLRM